MTNEDARELAQDSQDAAKALIDMLDKYAENFRVRSTRMRRLSSSPSGQARWFPVWTTIVRTSMSRGWIRAKLQTSTTGNTGAIADAVAAAGPVVSNQTEE